MEPARNECSNKTLRNREDIANRMYNLVLSLKKKNNPPAETSITEEDKLEIWKNSVRWEDVVFAETGWLLSSMYHRKVRDKFILLQSLLEDKDKEIPASNQKDDLEQSVLQILMTPSVMEQEQHAVSFSTASSGSAKLVADEISLQWL